MPGKFSSVGKPSLSRVEGAGTIESLDMPCLGNVRLIDLRNDPSVLSRTADQPRNDAGRADLEITPSTLRNEEREDEMESEDDDKRED